MTKKSFVKKINALVRKCSLDILFSWLYQFFLKKNILIDFTFKDSTTKKIFLQKY